MPEETSKITIIADLLKRDPAYKEVIDQLEERLYNRYMVYLADKPRFNAKTQAIPKEYLAQILSFKNTLELNKIAKKYNLSQNQRDAISAVLWKIFLREAEIKNLPQMLNGELGLNNIRIAYQMALDIAPIYMPVSDYLGDLGMVMKRWQYETPSEELPITINQFPIKPQAFAPTAPAVPPIRPPMANETRNMEHETQIAQMPENVTRDESIARVQETMARISGQMAKINNDKKSDVEPEYLPDTPPTHSANIIDLKNF